MEIKVLGAGCAKCKATLVKVEDIMELLNYNIMTTPAVVVDGEVKLKGHVPTENEVKKILGM